MQAAKEKREGGEEGETGPAEGPKEGGRKMGVPAEGAEGEEAPKRKSVRFGGEE